MKRLNKILLAMITIVIVLMSGCGSIEVKSIWQDGTIDLKDWRNYQTVLDEEDVSIAAFNDDNYLYLNLASFDRAKVRQIMMSGFTIWFNEGGEKVGLRYPIRKVRADSRQNLGMMDREKDTMWEIFSVFISDQSEYMIVNEDGLPLNAYPIDNEGGVKLNMEYQIGQLVYSLRIPLAGSTMSDFRLNSSPGGETLELQFETEEFQPQRRMPQGLGGGPQGGRRRPGAGSGNRDGFARPEPIDFSIELSLAKQ